MSGMRLIIGNKNYSSWSLRPWVLLKHARIKFDEVRIPLFTNEGEQMLEELCPAKQVPVLYDGQLVLWDSLAICEYVADKFPQKKLWPEADVERARARAMSAEMHSGFHALREKMPMNCRRRVTGFEPDLETEIDINRVVHLLEQALQDSKGPWLYGHYTVADAMYAPVVSRFQTYAIATPPATRNYIERVLNDASMKQWFDEASHETEIIEKAEIH